MSYKQSSVTEASDKAYSQYYADKDWNEFRHRDALRYLRYIGNTVSFGKRDAVLEVGCGTAEFGSIIGRQFGSDIYGIDINGVAIKQAKKNGVRAYKCDIERRWPFANQTFHCVIATQIIEHIVNTDFLVTESMRVLKRGGYLIIATPNLGAWFNRILLPLGYQPFFTEVSVVDKTFGLGFSRTLTSVRQPLGHLRCFTLKALIDLMTYYDFHIENVVGATVSYFPRYLHPADQFFSLFPSLATDLLVIARRD